MLGSRRRFHKFRVSCSWFTQNSRARKRFVTVCILIPAQNRVGEEEEYRTGSTIRCIAKGEGKIIIIIIQRHNNHHRFHHVTKCLRSKRSKRNSEEEGLIQKCNSMLFKLSLPATCIRGRMVSITAVNSSLCASPSYSSCTSRSSRRELCSHTFS